MVFLGKTTLDQKETFFYLACIKMTEMKVIRMIKLEKVLAVLSFGSLAQSQKNMGITTLTNLSTMCDFSQKRSEEKGFVFPSDITVFTVGSCPHYLHPLDLEVIIARSTQLAWPIVEVSC